MLIKKMSLKITFLAIIGIITTGLIINSLAQKTTQVEQPVTAEQKLIPAQEDFYATGETVEVKSDNIVGDAVLAGANVTVSGKVQGYVMAAGADVKINAPIGNDLWAAGANILVTEPIGDNAMLAGNKIRLEQNAIIGKDARIAADSVEINGKITRNLKIAAGSAKISSEIGGDVEAYTENLTLDPGAVVRGNLVVYSPNEPKISQQAQVLGNVDYHQTESGRNPSTAFGNWFGNWLLTFLWITVLGIVAVLFSSVWTNRVTEMLKRETGKSFLVGMIAILAVPVLFILLLVTIAGVPLAFLLGAMTLVAFLFSGVFISYFVGEQVLKRLKLWENSNVLKIVCGAFIITIVMSLPLIGWLAKFAVMFFGVGAFLLERRDLFRQMRSHGLA